MNKNIFSLFLLLLAIGLGKASETGKINFYQAGGNYYCYPWLNDSVPTQTVAPEGFVPFHIEHYGRHGSRWHIGNYNYDHPYSLLKKAHEAGKLTPLGEEVFEAVVEIREEFLKGRDSGLYYKWSDFKRYYTEKINEHKEKIEYAD